MSLKSPSLVEVINWKEKEPQREMGVLSCDTTNRGDRGQPCSFILSKSRVFGWLFFLLFWCKHTNLHNSKGPSPYRSGNAGLPSKHPTCSHTTNTGRGKEARRCQAGRASKNVSLQRHPNRTPGQPCHPSPSEAKLTYVPLSVHIRSLLTQKHCRTQYDAPTEKRASCSCMTPVSNLWRGEQLAHHF